MNSIYYGRYRVITIEYYTLHSPYTENTFFLLKYSVSNVKEFGMSKNCKKKSNFASMHFDIYYFYFFNIYFLSFFETDSFFCLLVFLIILKKATTKNSKIRYLFFYGLVCTTHIVCIALWNHNAYTLCND